ncbi:GAF domain-containing protein [Pedobacter panaciterrae]|uniref:GAF domain-containing protein n=1 Tax=Pedobacter panaciterrae TaxID=363849 RepID=UPI00155DAAC1|nr:GAF domain-containing protein [Pedobacter panaciterrae]NQX54035.1 GAF domain-containing protein [Pedobacter panaciterrae]
MSALYLDSVSPFLIEFSFEPVIKRLELISAASGHVGSAEATSLLQQIREFPELKAGITDAAIFDEQAPLIGRLLENYFPVDLTENEIKAVGLPYVSFAFNLTARFKRIMEQAGRKFEFSIRDFDQHQMYVLSSCIVLNMLYGTRLDFRKPLFYDIPTADGIIKHYRILYNADFLEIIPTESAVPLTVEDIDLLKDNYEDLDLWMRKIPPGSYILKGFAIMTLFDATIENAVSLFKGNLLDFNSAQFMQNLDGIFSSIFGIANLRVGYVVFCHDGDTFNEATTVQDSHSLILQDSDYSASESIILNDYWSMIKDQRYVAISNVERYCRANSGHRSASLFDSDTYKSIILAPVTKNNSILGVLEVVSPKTDELNSINALKLEVVMPDLAYQFERMVREMESKINAVIQLKFTTLHPSVNWKFREQAKLYLNASSHGLNQYQPEEICFDNIIPMYAQLDVKGSSHVRNLSAKKDLKNQLTAVLQLLKSADCDSVPNEIAELTVQVTALLRKISSAFQVSSEHEINAYLSGTVHPWLRSVTSKKLRNKLKFYFLACQKDVGRFHGYRRKYEQTISRINQTLANVLDIAQSEAQQIFPHYYERFKTDGVEHNLYIGQSIQPQHQYDFSKLSALRLWQLRTVCKMEVAHREEVHILPYPLEVTSLILVYNTEIAIRFRMDEKRFDVDGTYNARFEMVKKRIDKAHIKNTRQRITQPGKITIVCTSKVEEKEYIGYVQLLQSEKLLDAHLQKFDIEDLQGLSGLIGLRVGII